ncbi:MAG: DNA methyltransferase [Oscillospiraceae bacterium]
MEALFYSYPNPVDNKNAGIEVRRQQELTESELFLLRQAGLDRYAPLEAWTALGTNAQINYSTHGIFRYFGKIPSTIAAHLIMQYTKEFDTVMDPMAGSGTTALESLLSNRNCRTYDVSPLSLLLSKVKTTHIDRAALEDALQEIIRAYRPLTAEEFDWQPAGLRDVDHWFLRETQDSIRGLIFQINRIADPDVRDFYRVCLAASVRTVSRATTQQGRLFLDVATAKEDCLETFVKKASKAIGAVSALPEKKVRLDISSHDAGTGYDLGPTNHLAIVHPPYFNSYKYSSVNSLELAWMGVDHAHVRKNEIREFFKVGKAEKIGCYVDDMSRTLHNVAATLRPNGVLALMIGDTMIKGEYMQATKMLLDRFLADDPQMQVEKMVLRVPKYTEASWSTSQRRKSDKIGISLNDFIVICRRGTAWGSTLDS